MATDFIRRTVILTLLFISIVNSQTLDSIAIDWVKFYPGSFAYVKPNKMVVDSSEYIYITGTDKKDINSYTDFLTLKYDSSGILQWDAYYNGVWNESDVPLDIFVDRHKNVFITGYSYDSLDIVYSSPLRLNTIKYDEYGVLKWSKYKIEYFNNRPLASLGRTILGSDSNIYVAGYITDSVQYSGARDFLTIRYDYSGNEIWRKRFVKDGDNQVEAMAIDCHDNILVTGYAENFNVGRVLLTVKYDKLGNLIWHREFYQENSKEYFAKKILTDQYCNIYIVGDFNSPGNAKDIFLIKYSKNGELLWNLTYDSGNHRSEYCWDATYDNKNSIFISGSTSDSISYVDFLVLKYDTDGTKVWDAFYTSPMRYSNDVAKRITYDQYDNIYVTGYSSGQDLNLDMVVLKYNDSGKQISEFRYSKSKCSWDEPVSISISKDGYIYIAGRSVCSSDSSYITILKLKQLQSIKDEKSGNYIYQNYPNPFSRFTTIKYYLKSSSRVKLTVFDVLGRKISTLVDREMPSGFNTTVFSAEAYSSGIYFYSLTVNKYTQTRKLLLIK